jgi:Domain of unknown function (DUF4288)
VATDRKAYSPAKSEIPFQNRSPTGWWIASYLLRFEFNDEDRNNLNRRCTAYENTLILQANDRDEAFRKATRLGKQGDKLKGWNSFGRKGVWRFEGLTSLLPIYEELEDGAEILWREYSNRTVRKIKSFVRSRKNLPVFDDTDSSSDS